MKLGIRGHDLPVGKEESLVSALAECDIDALQLVCYKSFADVEYKINSINEEKAKAIGKALSEKEVSLIGAYFNPVHPNEEKAKTGFEIFKEYLAFSKLIGCDIVGSETGSVNGDKWIYHPENRTDKSRTIVCETFSDLCDYASKFGARVGIEGAAGHVMHDVKTLYTACEKLSKDNLRVIFDLFNFLDESNSTDYLKIMDDGLAAFSGKIHCFHIKDCCIKQNEKPVQCPVGKGDLNFTEILTRIKRQTENPLFILEGTTGGDIPYAVSFIRNAWNSL